jgi:hypothetical protein
MKWGDKFPSEYVNRRIPLSSSVKHTNLKGNDRLRFTILYKRLTYSDGNLSPHFIQMIFTFLANATWCERVKDGSYQGERLGVIKKWIK